MVKSTTGDARAGEVQDLLSLILSLEQGFMWDDNYATTRLDKLSLDANAVSVLSKLYGLLAVQVYTTQTRTYNTCICMSSCTCAKQRNAHMVQTLLHMCIDMIARSIKCA
jgi:hypothetical protein